MIFQTFDDKQYCLLVYKDNKFLKQLTPSCTHTWSYASYLSDKDIEYASLYTPGKSLKEVCRKENLAHFEEIQNRIKGVVNSCYEVGLNLSDICIYEVIPQHILATWADIKTNICQDIFNSIEKPPHYEQLLKITKLITDIKQKDILLDISKLPRVSVQDKNIYKLISNCHGFIDYDMHKTITGRLSTRKDSFPVLTLAKKYRQVLLPTNNWLFEMDFNACELRTALALLGHDQPNEDLHDWNLKNVFTRAKSRDNAKKRIFSWLYNPRNKDDKVSKIYDREKLKTLYYKENKVITPFGRQIECDEDHAVNYLIQSTAADLVFEQIYKVWEYLEGRKSFVKFCNHDSVMIDLDSEQEYEFNQIKEIFCDTRFGRFKVNCLGGKNWFDMKQIHVQ